MSNKCDILNLEWVSNGRDTHIVEPVLVSLEQRFGYSIVRSSIWEAVIKLLWYRPKVLLIANDVGAEPNVKAFHFANRLGIKTVSLISEGIRTVPVDLEHEKESVDSFFWGDNFDKEVYWDLKLLWSSVVYEDIKKWIPPHESKNLKVCGGTGFDRYKLFGSRDKRSIVNRIGIKEKRIVLLIGWGFDSLRNQILILDDSKEDVTYKKKVQRYNQKNKLRAIYSKLIKENPDIAFILKYHPGTTDYRFTEFYGLDSYNNTYSIKNELEISELISVSDLLIAYESTTALEAWLLDKVTIFVDPGDEQYDRMEIYKGVDVVKSYEELSSVLDKLYSGKVIEGFEDKKTIREKIIHDCILYGDGLNYLRSSKTIDKFIRSSNKKKSFVDFSFIISIIGEILYEIAVCLIEKTPFGFLKRRNRNHYRKRRKLYDSNVRKAVTKKYYKAIFRYEKENGSKVNDILNSF